MLGKFRPSSSNLGWVLGRKRQGDVKEVRICLGAEGTEMRRNGRNGGSPRKSHKDPKAEGSMVVGGMNKAPCGWSAGLGEERDRGRLERQAV